METDEYEISICRELGVCKTYIREIERSLCRLEERHGIKTEQAIANFRAGTAVDRNGELAAWVGQHQSLERWRQREAEYEALLRSARTRMK